MKKYILVVDDDQLILYALAKILHNDGYEVITAATATEAIAKLSYCPYDLCLLDVHLPDLSGLELMEIVKVMCPKTKIIIMTASHIDAAELSENNNKAMANGADYFFAKPFNLCDARELVHDVLAGVENSAYDVRFNNNGSAKKSRKKSRKPCNENIRFQMSVIDQGVVSRRTIEAQAVDISDSGIGLLIRHPLRESQVIGFDDTMDNRTGVVVWSKMVDDENCRVGIRFA